MTKVSKENWVDDHSVCSVAPNHQAESILSEAARLAHFNNQRLRKREPLWLTQPHLQQKKPISKVFKPVLKSKTTSKFQSKMTIEPSTMATFTKPKVFKAAQYMRPTTASRNKVLLR